MKRGLSGRTRRGAPPLPQQRRALRVVQVVLLALSVFFGWLTIQSITSLGAMTSPKASGFASIGKTADTGIGEVIALAFFAVLCLAGAVAMGLRIVRGPTPPEL